MHVDGCLIYLHHHYLQNIVLSYMCTHWLFLWGRRGRSPLASKTSWVLCMNVQGVKHFLRGFWSMLTPIMSGSYCRFILVVPSSCKLPLPPQIEGALLGCEDCVGHWGKGLFHCRWAYAGTSPAVHVCVEKAHMPVTGGHLLNDKASHSNNAQLNIDVMSVQGSTMVEFALWKNVGPRSSAGPPKTTKSQEDPYLTPTIKQCSKSEWLGCMVWHWGSNYIMPLDHVCVPRLPVVSTQLAVWKIRLFTSTWLPNKLPTEWAIDSCFNCLYFFHQNSLRICTLRRQWVCMCWGEGCVAFKVRD